MHTQLILWVLVVALVAYIVVQVVGGKPTKGKEEVKPPLVVLERYIIRVDDMTREGPNNVFLPSSIDPHKDWVLFHNGILMVHSAPGSVMQDRDATLWPKLIAFDFQVKNGDIIQLLLTGVPS
jgi:hypothetical protein